MNTEQLAEIKARCDAATPGPWEQTLAPSNVDLVIYKIFYDLPPLFADGDPQVRSVAILPGATDLISQRDAKFIAHARTDIPALLDEVVRLQSFEWRHKAAVKACSGCRMIRRWI